MANRCEFCDKGTTFGRNVPAKGLLKKHGGNGRHRGVTTSRTFKANLVNKKATINGTRCTVKICTRCLKSGKLIA